MTIIYVLTSRIRVRIRELFTKKLIEKLADILEILARSHKTLILRSQKYLCGIDLQQTTNMQWILSKNILKKKTTTNRWRKNCLKKVS